MTRLLRLSVQGRVAVIILPGGVRAIKRMLRLIVCGLYS